MRIENGPDKQVDIRDIVEQRIPPQPDDGERSFAHRVAQAQKTEAEARRRHDEKMKLSLKYSAAKFEFDLQRRAILIRLDRNEITSTQASELIRDAALIRYRAIQSR